MLRALRECGSSRFSLLLYGTTDWQRLPWPALERSPGFSLAGGRRKMGRVRFAPAMLATGLGGEEQPDNTRISVSFSFSFFFTVFVRLLRVYTFRGWVVVLPEGKMVYLWTSNWKM
jgi:hypothetical protein